MGAEDQIRPQLGVGPQPNAGGAQPNSPIPPGQQPDPGSLPAFGGAAEQQQAPAQPLSQPQPQPQGQQINPQESPMSLAGKKLDEDAGSIAGEPTSEEKLKDFEAKLNGGGGAPEQGEDGANHPFFQGIKNSVFKDLKDWAQKESDTANPKTKVKLLAGKAMEEVGRNENEKITGVQKIFGIDNVQMRGKDLWVKPDGSKSFYKLNETVLSPIMDFMASKILQAPGMAARLGVGAAVGAATIPAGAAFGGMAGPGGAMLGAAAGGSVAGASAEKAGNVVDDKVNSILGIKDPNFDVNAKTYHDMTVGAVTGAVGGVVGQAFSSHLADKVAQEAATLTPEETQAVNEAGNLTALGKVRSAFNQFVSHIKGTNPATRDVSLSAVEAEGKRLSDVVGGINTKAVDLARQSGQKVNANQTMEEIRNFMSNQMHTPEDPLFRENGSLIEDNKAFRALSDDAMIKKMGRYYKELYGDSFGGGSDLGKHIQDVRDLYDLKTKLYSSGDANQASSVNNIYKATRLDRDSTLSSVFESSESPEALTWKQSYGEYSDKIDAINRVKSSLGSDAAKDTLVGHIYGSGESTPRLDLVKDLKFVLGKDSQEWNSIRGDVIKRITMTGNQQGVVNAVSVGKWMDAPRNAELLGEIFQNNTEKNVFRALVGQSRKISTAEALSDGDRGIISKGVDSVSSFFKGSPKAAVDSLWSMFGRNKAAITELSDALISASNKVSGPEQKQMILSMYNMNQAAMNKCRVVDVKNAMGTFQKFVYGPAAASVTSATAGSVMQDASGAIRSAAQPPQEQPMAQ